MEELGQVMIGPKQDASPARQTQNPTSLCLTANLTCLASQDLVSALYSPSEYLILTVYGKLGQVVFVLYVLRGKYRDQPCVLSFLGPSTAVLAPKHAI